MCTANLLQADDSICVTDDGINPTILSFYKPKAPIFAITKNEEVARQLSVIWNVQPVFVEFCSGLRDLIQKGVEKFKEMKFLIPGDTVVIIGDDNEEKEGKHSSIVSTIMKAK